MPDPRFQLFGPDHLAMLAITAALCGLLVWRGGALSERARRAISLGLAANLILYAIAFYAVNLSTRGFRWGESLPLNVCDIVLIGCIAALLLRSQLGFEIAYFWGLAGTLQGLITPDLRSGFPTFRYFHFFWGHVALVVTAAWLIAAERRRARPGAVLRMMGVLNAYVVVVGALDWIFGWNYGYLRHRPSHGSLLDALGPWPWYLVWCELIALGLFSILALPFRKGEGAGDGDGALSGS